MGHALGYSKLRIWEHQHEIVKQGTGCLVLTAVFGGIGAGIVYGLSKLIEQYLF